MDSEPVRTAETMLSELVHHVDELVRAQHQTNRILGQLLVARNEEGNEASLWQSRPALLYSEAPATRDATGAASSM